jgi:hypothetical protein
MVFLSMDGLYALPAGGETFPISLSREVIPTKLRYINPTMVDVSLEYDIQGRGIHIFLTSISSNSRSHWWMDWNRKSFWPVSLQEGHEPTATCSLQSNAIEESSIILGGRDGKLRRYNHLSEDDCGTSFSSYAVLGPVALNVDTKVGTIVSIATEIAVGSGSVAWSIIPALTFEGLLTGTTSASGTWIAGLNANVRPACRGQAFNLRLDGTAGRRWALENITATIKEGGVRRIS